MLKDENYILVDSEESLAGLLQDLELYDMAAVDTEADSMHHYASKLCLIQITIGEHHYIVDPLCGLDISPLFKAKAMQTLIFHGADYDLRLLWQGEEHLGLADLVRKYFGDELKKENQRADWSIRPLPLEMCEYAIHDTFYLHELCAILAEKLQNVGRLQWLMEQCDALIEHSKEQGHVKKDPWRIPGSNALPPQGLNILKHVWEWREKEAEALDRPPYKVMPAELILSIVRHVMRDFPELKLERLPKLPRNFRETRLDSFLAMLQQAIDTPESEWPAKLPRSAPPAVVPHSELLAALKIWRDEKAVELNLDNSLVANKNQLVWLGVPGDTPWETRYENAHLLGWQKIVWTQILQEHLDKAERIGV